MQQLSGQIQFLLTINLKDRENEQPQGIRSDTKDLPPLEATKAAPWMNLYNFWWFHKYRAQHNILWFMPVLIPFSIAIYYLGKI